MPIQKKIEIVIIKIEYMDRILTQILHENGQAVGIGRPLIQYLSWQKPETIGHANTSLSKQERIVVVVVVVVVVEGEVIRGVVSDTLPPQLLFLHENAQ